MLWVVFLLLGAFVIGYLAWDFRKKAEAREAASRKRFEEMVRAQASASPRAAAPPAAVAASSAPTAVPAPAAAAAASERFLGQRATLLYYLLKTGLPDHEIFANVSLASVVASPSGGGEREQQLRRLAPYRLDFVVCDKNFRIVAAVELDAADGADAAGARQFKAEFLQQAGIRLVRVDPASMPRREQVRSLVGGPGPGATA